MAVILVTILICGNIVFAKEDVKLITERDAIKVLKGKTVEDPLIEKEREWIIGEYLDGKNGSDRIFVYSGEIIGHNKKLFKQPVKVKGTEKPKEVMNEGYSTTWDATCNMIYSDYIFPKGKFTAEADGPFNICLS